MIEWINSYTMWQPENHILVCWRHDSLVLNFSNLTIWAQLVLQASDHDPHILRVAKMRGSTLSNYHTELDSLFEEYEIVDDGWRGQIRVSDAELTRWHLLCGS